MARDRKLSSRLDVVEDRPQFDWTRLEPQYKFLTGTNEFLLLSGGFGNGKTTVLAAKVLALLQVPGNLGYLGRLDGKALRQTTLQVLLEMLPKEHILTNNIQQGFLQLKPEAGGSKLVYGDFKDLGDLKNHPLGFFAIDQAEEINQETWDFLAGRLRRIVPIVHPTTGHRQYWVKGTCPKNKYNRHFSVGPALRCALCSQKLPEFDDSVMTSEDVPPWEVLAYRRFGLAVANPEGPEHFLFKYFPGLPGIHGLSGPGKPGYRAFHATIYDGMKAGFIPPSYVKSLETLYATNPVMKARYLDGTWVAATGLVYPEWRPDVHILDNWASRKDGTPLIPDSTKLYEYIDPGMTSPTAVGWVAVVNCPCGCQKQDYFVIADHYVAGRTISYHAKSIQTIRKQLGKLVQATYLDSQAFSKNQVRVKGSQDPSGLDDLFSLADEYEDNGILCIPTQKNWDAGYNRISELLKDDPSHHHPVTGAKGAPHLYVFNICANVIHEFNTYKWKKIKHLDESYREEPVDKDDHHMDGLNGFLTSRPVQSTHHEEVKDPDAWWLKELDDELASHGTAMSA